MQKAILHMDMDAFYASVEILDDPSLKGKSVIVGGSNERGVVSSASYKARGFGVHSAQPVAAARRLCPKGTFLPVRIDRYKEMSRAVFNIFRRFTPLVEPLSIDEAFLDVSHSFRIFGTPEDIALKIKHMVFEELGLTVSAGVAPCKFAAKIASDLEKPDGLSIVPEGGVREFLAPLPIGKLWGVGRETREALSSFGIRTIGDLSAIPRETLEARFGKHGSHLYLLAQGIDDREVVPTRETRSIGREHTFGRDLTEPDDIRRELLSLATKVSSRLRGEQLEGKTVTLKVKYMNFVQITRSLTLVASTDDGGKLFQSCCQLLEKTEAGTKAIRLLGISVSQVRKRVRSCQYKLFETERETELSRRLNLAVDRIREKYGEKSILPGTLVDRR